MSINKYWENFTVWNAKFNVIGRSISKDKILNQADQLLCFGKNYLCFDNTTILDIGSGSGIPGIFWAMNGIKNINLVERSVNRACFLRYMKLDLNLNINVHNTDIKHFIFDLDIKNLIITAQAFATILNLLKYTEHLFKHNPNFILLKQSNVIDEIKEAQKQYEFKYIIEDTQFGKHVFLNELKRR